MPHMPTIKRAFASVSEYMRKQAVAPRRSAAREAEHSNRRLVTAAATASALLLATLTTSHAHAEPISGPSGPPAEISVPSGPPAKITFPDGYTLSLVASRETQQPIPALTPDLISRDVIVGGTFTGLIEKYGSPATASGTVDVGYQVGCDSPNSMLFGMMDQLKPGESTVSISQQEFSGTTPTVEIEGYRLHIDRCPGPAFIRSYAVLTRTGTQASSAVYYYGVPKRIDPIGLPG